MRTPFFFALALCSFISAHAADTLASEAGVHPLTASWSWTLPGTTAGTTCTEQLHYRADGTRQGRSGNETTQSRYEVAAIPSLLGFYRLTETVTESNGKPDCSGDLHPANSEPVTRFIQFSPGKDQLIVCREESLQACYGPLKRQPVP